MTKREAIEALNNGHKITHEYFSETEWIIFARVESGVTFYKTEDGYLVSSDVFWHDRKGQAWETGWSLWGS